MSDFTLWFAANAQQYDSNISINKIYLVATGNDYDLSIFISQIIFRANGQSKLGFSKFYKTDLELGQELGFSRGKIQRLKKKLLLHEIGEFFGFEAHKISNTPTTHWYVDFEKLCEYLYRINNPKVPLQPPNDMDCSDTNNGKIENEQSSERSETNNLTLHRSEPDTNSLCPSDERLKVSSADDNFKTLWQVWPNSKKRQRAEKAFKSVLRVKKLKSPTAIADFSTMLKTDIEERLRLTNNVFDHGLRNSLFSTYLNGKEWDEELPVKPVDIANTDEARQASDAISRELFVDRYKK